MRRGYALRAVVVLATLVWAAYQLFPTFMVGRLKDQAESHSEKITNLTGVQRDDINSALSRGLLEQTIPKSVGSQSPDKLKSALDEAKSLIAINDKIAKYENRAIKRGLDLQGGSYLVYEVNLPRLVRDVAKNKDQRFEDLIRKTETKAAAPNVDFFQALEEEFSREDVRLSRYFGTRAQTDAQILEALKKGSNDAVDRNLEILRNRIDQFGVSEPSITKQGDRRIIIELAGITDVGRAKNIIGQTALLEFQLVKDPQVVNEVLTKINEVMKRDIARRGGKVDTSKTDTTATVAEADTAAKPSKVRSEEEVSVEELFGESSIMKDTLADTTGSDSTLLVDQEVFEENPFFSLIADFRNDVGVPSKNLRAVERILNNPEVQKTIPADAEFAWDSKPEVVADNQWYRLYLMKKEPELTGGYLTDANASIGSGAGVTRQGEWIVNMEMNSEGARIFSRVTGANVNKRLAIVLDGKVKMAPNIDERIPSGRAIIRGSMGSQEAQDLAIVLRAGSLQAPMHVIEERSVGPSLGRDSISKGTYSAILGFLLVVVFMTIYYRMSGLVANLALLLNVVLLMAALALFKATLTLPGVAGIILTIGMAVDANVLIFERIREELRQGKTVTSAIKEGYGRAFWTIFDSNLTTLLTALVLYQFGTGPIRGFAVTLSIGIVMSMFTALFVTRLIFDFVVSRRRVATLSI